MQLFLVLWLVLFFYVVIKNIIRFVENENSPVVTVPATVVDMRRKTHHHHHQHGHHHSHSYHVTFELPDGERKQLRVLRMDYLELDTGDKGMLTYQGTRYKGFARE